MGRSIFNRRNLFLLAFACTINFSAGDAYAVRVVEVYPTARPGEVLRGNVSVVQAVPSAVAAAPALTKAAGIAAPNPPPVTTHPVGDPVADQAQNGIDEAMRARALEAQTYGAVNSSNPISDSFNPAESEALPPEVREKVEKIQRILNNPMVHKYLQVFSDPKLGVVAQKLVESGALKTLGIVQFTFLILWMFFKAYVMQGAETFSARMGRSTLLSLSYVFLAGFLIPYSVLGSPYLEIASCAIRGFSSSPPKPVEVAPEMRLPAAASVVPPTAAPAAAAAAVPAGQPPSAIQAALSGQLPPGLIEPEAGAAAPAPAHPQ